MKPSQSRKESQPDSGLPEWDGKLFTFARGLARQGKEVPAKAFLMMEGARQYHMDQLNRIERALDMEPSTSVEVADRVVASFPSETGTWIACAERMPVAEDYVLVFLPRSETKHVAWYDEQEGCWFDPYDADGAVFSKRISMNSPSHWMPLPGVPNRQKGEV